MLSGKSVINFFFVSSSQLGCDECEVVLPGMNQATGLKYALVLVLVTSAVLLGWTTYLERSADSKIEAFAEGIGRAQSEQQAKQVIKNFLDDSQKTDAALSASADDTGCAWLCE